MLASIAAMARMTAADAPVDCADRSGCRGDWVDGIGAMHALIGAISMEHWSQCSG